MSHAMPFFKAYPKDIAFELRAVDPQDAPLVFYLATVTWPDGGIDPNDERQLSRLRRMLGWRKDTFTRALKSYIEVCGEGAGKLLPSFCFPVEENFIATPEWKQIRKRILKRDKYICGYCGSHAKSVDHVVPRSIGGDHDEDNLVAACKSCNSRKNGRTPEQALMPIIFRMGGRI